MYKSCSRVSTLYPRHIFSIVKCFWVHHNGFSSLIFVVVVVNIIYKQFFAGLVDNFRQLFLRTYVLKPHILEKFPFSAKIFGILGTIFGYKLNKFALEKVCIFDLIPKRKCSGCIS